MADLPFGDLYPWIRDNDPTRIIKTLENVLVPSTYNFESDVFPEDLASEQIQHYMVLSMFAPTGYGGLLSGYTGALGGGFKTNVYNVALFMPSEAGGGIFPNFSDTHEFSEISMTNILMGQTAAAKFAKAAARSTGRIINPAVQILYKTTHLRTFEFAFLFAPRSENESRSMKNIIKKIRKFAAPEDQGVFYRAPAEITIEFHWKDKINDHVIKMKRQVITAIDVNYAPHGVYSTFTNGHPVSCMFAIKTREMEIIDREDVENGY